MNERERAYMIPDMFRLDGKIAVVTGAGHPFARAVGEALAQAGANVVAVSHRPEAAEALAHAARTAGRASIAVVADTSRVEDVQRLAEVVSKRFDVVDILVAGEEALVAGPLAELSETDWDSVMAVNVKSVFLCAQAFGRAMTARGSGRVIAIAHALGIAGVPNTVAYSASKGAVVQLVRSLGLEWAAKGVTVNAIAPGWFREGWDESGDDPLVRFIPVRRRGEPDELGPLAVYLASDSAAYVTSSIYIIDGAQICHG